MHAAHGANPRSRTHCWTPARALGLVALVLFAGVMGFLIFGAQVGANASSPSVPASPGAPDRVVAYYFHVTVRCATCRKIESYSREAIEQGFAKDLQDGRLEWRPVNVQLPENRHFIRDYQLFTRSLVVVKIRGGKQVEYRNLEKVWDLVGDKAGFLKYVQANVRAYLGAG